MKYYMAPMEGVTNMLYRSVHQELFGGVDKYFAPFLVPNGGSIGFKKNQLRDILPENNKGQHVIPQLLTNDAKKFLDAAKEIKDLGYEEINLNLGCPSGTVVAKKKGSGFLADVDDLDRFLYEIFETCDMKISVKTRLGIRDVEEFDDILEVYNKYKMEELILHPRLQKEMYKLRPHLELVRHILENSTNKICYNGDIFDPLQKDKIQEEFPKIDCMMVGRGVIANPALFRELRKSASESTRFHSGIQESIGESRLQMVELKKFHDKLLEANKEYLSGDTNLMYRMKAYWYYFIMNFENYKKVYKKLQKAKNLAVYQDAVDEIFTELKITGYFNPY